MIFNFVEGEFRTIPFPSRPNVETRLEVEYLKKKKGKVLRIWKREKEDREEMIFNLSRTSFVIPLSSKNPLKSKLNNECRRNEE